MRKRDPVVTAMVLLSAVWVMAQSTGRQSAYPNSTTPSNQQPAAAMAPVSETQTSSANKHDSLLEGCIGGSNDRITLTDAAGKVYQLRGDTAKLSDHIGQHASIMGTEEHGSTPGLDGAQTTFTVKKVAIIASVCANSR
jgi:FlaG/FlaF family flagellin (archaellin)